LAKELQRQLIEENNIKNSKNDDHDNGNHNNDHEDDDEDDNEEEDDGDYTPSSDGKNEKIYRDTDEIKTTGNEALIPTDRLRDLLGHVDITIAPEYRIKRILCPGWDEYRAVVEVFNGPNVLNRHMGPAFRATYSDA
jgi:hypothetical protein